jgi:hypothetical protein
MSGLIDLSAATPGSRGAIAEKEFSERLRETALVQMLGIINQSKPALHPAQLKAIELLQTEGIAVAVEFLAQKCDIGEHEWVKLIRSQIIAKATQDEQAARDAFEAEQKVLAAAPQPEAAPEGILNVSIGFAPEANAENAGAIRSALLAAFVQLSQKYPDSVIEPTIARVALQWIPPEEDPYCEEARDANNTAIIQRVKAKSSERAERNESDDSDRTRTGPGHDADGGDHRPA